MSNWDEQLDLLIRARTPIIWIRSNEEERVETLLQNSTKRLSPRRLASWDYINGISNVLNSNNLGSRQPMAVLEWLIKLDESSPTILLLKDFHHFRPPLHLAPGPLPICSLSSQKKMIIVFEGGRRDIRDHEPELNSWMLIYGLCVDTFITVTKSTVLSFAVLWLPTQWYFLL